MKSSIF